MFIYPIHTLCRTTHARYNTTSQMFPHEVLIHRTHRQTTHITTAYTRRHTQAHADALVHHNYSNFHNCTTFNQKHATSSPTHTLTIAITHHKKSTILLSAMHRTRQRHGGQRETKPPFSQKASQCMSPLFMCYLSPVQSYWRVSAPPSKYNKRSLGPCQRK